MTYGIRSGAVAVAFLALTTAPLTAQVDSARATVAIDSAHREVVITIGPLTIPNLGQEEHAHSHSMAAHETRMYRAVWPVEGWFRGFRVELEDAEGHRMSGRFLHHVSMVNFARRQLIYPAFERLLGASQEHAGFRAPPSIGVPMHPGMELGTFIGWHNSTGHEIDGVRLIMRMEWMPPTMLPRPLDVHLLWMDVSYHSGSTDAFDLPPGRSTRSYEFTMPLSGRILIAGGHLHNYAKYVRLEDAKSGHVLVNLVPKTDSLGRLKKVPTRYYGIVGDGIKLRKGRRYRITTEYDTPGTDTLKKGAMALIVAAFVPDRPERWPALNLADEGIQRDLAMLKSLGPKPVAERTMDHGTHHPDETHLHTDGTGDRP